MDTSKGIEKFTCHQVRMFEKRWKENFKKKNRSDEIMKKGARDRYFDQYCNSLDEFLKKCSCEVKLNIEMCEKCSVEDHEGHFCRCEMRNIEIAKILRKEDKSPWLNREEK